ncbi:PP2C family protein-serine/threonine phosphatase [Streptomyces griseus]|uniref:PP2C family protein-serine/threonine phosphatase n=1 Tax=Streptomyces griseus TaxID=1911 RepID=UPI0036FF65A5
MPAFLIVFGVVFQVATPEQVTGTPFFVVAPLMAAPFYTWWGTLAFGAAGLGGELLLRLLSEPLSDSIAAQDLATELSSITFATAMAVVLNRAATRGLEDLAAARGVAESAQRAVLPEPAERIGSLRLNSRYEAARQDTLIGGDFYAARATPYGTRLVIGDVRGKGLGAIETVSIILGAFWEAADAEGSLTGVAQKLDDALTREPIHRSGYRDAEGFATCVLAEITDETGSLHILNLGHPPPLLLRADGSASLLVPHSYSVPLGLSQLLPEPWAPDTWDFPAGATLLLYTDGLSEARDTAGDFYDPVARLEGKTFSSPKRMLNHLAQDVRSHAGSAPTDDMALLAVHRPGGVDR